MNGGDRTVTLVSWLPTTKIVSIFISHGTVRQMKLVDCFDFMRAIQSLLFEKPIPIIGL